MVENELNSETPVDGNVAEEHAPGGETVIPYQPFPTFEQWGKCTLDDVRWKRYKDQLEQHKQAPLDQFQKAQDIVKRVAAIETGVIEELYPSDRSFTLTVASGVAIWEAKLSKKDQRTQTLIASQMEAYDYVMDFASGKRAIVVTWIRELHGIICKGQETYRVLTPQNFDERPFPRGDYKTQPNYISLPDGRTVEGASVIDTPIEMGRLCDELHSERFIAAHPVLQASYAHYALVAIHPFPDGNGRVARALASIFTYRAISVPLLIVDDNGREYRNALAFADQGAYQPFVDFILERTLDAIRLIDESLKTAQLPSLKDSMNDIKRLYMTKGDYTHREVDGAGHDFFALFHSELKRQLSEEAESTDKFQVAISRKELNNDPKHQYGARKGYRWSVHQGQPMLSVRLETSSPASATVWFRFVVEVPADSGLEDDLIIYELDRPTISVEARISELYPHPGMAIELRIRMSVERVASQLVQMLRTKANSALRKTGY